MTAKFKPLITLWPSRFVYNQTTATHNQNRASFVWDCSFFLVLIPFFSGRKEVEDVKHDFDLLIHYMDHEYKFNVHKAITDGHNKQLAV